LKTSSRSALQAAAAIAVVRRRGVEIWGINTIAKAVFGMFAGGFFFECGLEGISSSLKTVGSL
jgi:hypothetical protein